MIQRQHWLQIIGLGIFLVLLSWNSFTQPTGAASHPDGNRLTYLDQNDPFYVHLNFPKLATPQWVGEPGVEAVVILAIDDLRETPKYETVLRPLFERLKQIDGRAPVSIFCNTNDPGSAQFQAWLKEGVSLEAHTLTHPCPCLARSNFLAAANNYHDCVDLLNKVPGNKPAAFRMPCCDSMNSPSPRFYAEIFNGVSAAGQFLTIDSSVMNLITPKDQSLPRDLVLDANGRERFRKYFPAATNQTTRLAMDSFVTTIEDYPYPYVIGRLCWEFPPMVPSDWEANNAHGPTNAVTVADWEAALDAAVLKQGTFTFIFHPHGWIRPQQMVEFVDYAVKKHGKKVKFLNFRGAQERLDQNLLAGQPLRAADGQDNGVRLVDLNNDGYLDVVIANGRAQKTRLWNPKDNRWVETGFPSQVAGLQFGVLDPTGEAFAIRAASGAAPDVSGAWRFDHDHWVEDKSLLNGLTVDGQPVLTIQNNRDRGVRLRDADNDGRCELIVGNETQNAVFGWSDAEKSWKKLAYSLPSGTSIVDALGRDNGLRFVDINEDGYTDVLFSNEESYSVHQFVSKANPRLSWEVGWNDEVVAGKRDGAGTIPMIVRGGTPSGVGVPPALTARNNGVWFHSGQMWVQNEDTAALPNVVDRRSFKQLLTADQPPPKSPEEALASIQVRPGFKVELVAAEPLVLDPIAFEWGADGKLWVVEMGDYPRGLDGNGKPGGIVRFLEDTDGDGRYDKSTVFLEGVNFPTGIMPWRKGVIVSTAPEIFYAEDTDGDGKADVRKTLFTGFGEGNQQHRVNGFDYGLDNWLYAANGDSGGTITAVVGQSSRQSDAARPINLRGHDLRLQPDEGRIETVAGQTQYGRHRDDWGNWFGNNNPTWLWHYFLPEQYLARNPHLAVKTTKEMLANYPDSTRCYPNSRTLQRFNDPAQANHVTSGNSPMPYRDEVFGPDFATSVFISEPVHNLVHHEVLEPDGISFKSHRAPDEQETEFLRSSDNWFRPTMLKTGPDGALYIADMYRLVIEHPEWIPPAIQQRLDLRAGADKGRIYRVYPEGAKLRRIPRLDKLDTAGLVAALDSANGWQRDTAERLLAHRGDKAAAEPLKKLIAGSSRQKARVQALWTLGALGSLTPEVAVAGLKDSQPAIRETAVQLCELFLRDSAPGRAPSQVGGPLLELTGDPEPRVRQQLAFTLGEWDDPRAAEALVKLGSDARFQIAVMSSALRHVRPMLAALFADGAASAPSASLVEQLIGLAIALNDDIAFTKALGEIAKPRDGKYIPWQFAAMAGVLDALDRQKTSLQKFQAAGKADLKSIKLEELFASARSSALNPKAPEPERLDAIRLLGRGVAERDKDLERLGELLRPEVPSALQEAALTALKRSSGARVAEVALEGWKGYGPALRTEVLNVLFSRPEWLRALLAAIESEAISTAGIGTIHQQKLVTHGDGSIRQRAEKLFSATRGDRQALLKEYRGVEKLQGDPAKGVALFRQNCLPCHRFKGEGNEIGADLNTMAGKPIQTLLVAILDPNQAVEPRYVNYIAVTKSEREVSGVITAETATSITIRSPGGNEEVILRSDLKELTSSGLSLMPEGFEKALAAQDMANLIAYILAK